ncbi:MAG: hypothetical protein ACLGHL_10345 [Actinomycetota bacterium]
MFVRIIEAQVTDPARIRGQFEWWVSDVRPVMTGFLGSTAGVTEDGHLFLSMRFTSAGEASDSFRLYEHDLWWKETEQLLDDVTFKDCTEVRTFGTEVSDETRFVQVIQGRPLDAGRFTTIAERLDRELAPLRPDLIGGMHVTHPDGAFSDINHFTTEDEARAGERRMNASPSISALLREWDSLTTDVRYLDLREPWLISPRGKGRRWP